jgi:hypothetical protein
VTIRNLQPGLEGPIRPCFESRSSKPCNPTHPTRFPESGLVGISRIQESAKIHFTAALDPIATIMDGDKDPVREIRR